MRLLVVIVLLCAAVMGRAQELTCVGAVPKITHVIDMPGKNAEELYMLANRWIAKNFQNKEKVIQTALENEMIRGKGLGSGVVKVNAMTVCDLLYTFTIDIKDEKFRFTMSDMSAIGRTNINLAEYSCTRSGAVRKGGWGDNVNQSLLDYAESLIVSLHDFPHTDAKSDDW